jgi:alkylation response protein AidB-like acyl-CoA dehydrogenase
MSADVAIEPLDAFVERATAWVADNLRPLDGAPLLTGHAVDDLDHVVRAKDIQRRMWEAGLAGLCFPREYGGQGLPPEYQAALTRVTDGYEIAALYNTPTLSIILPTILEFGTPEQKERYIPPTLRGELLWVQLLSEPSSGSDLAGVRTTAVRDGDAFVLNGSKIWSTWAWKADYGILVARTNWDVAKHRGISVFVLPLHQEGIDIQRIRHVDGTEEFCQEFFDDVLVPVEDVIGVVDEGWTVARALLGYERSAVGGGSPHVLGPVEDEGAGSGMRAEELAQRVGRSDDPGLARLVGEAAMLERAHHCLVDRVNAALEAGAAPEASGSILRLSLGMSSLRLSDIELDIVRDRAIAWDEGDPLGRVGVFAVGRQGGCLGGGSTEIARNIIAERVLGMPRERSEDADRPFREVRSGS